MHTGVYNKLYYFQYPFHFRNDTWNYDPNLLTTVERIHEKLDKFYAAVEKDKINRLSRMNLYFQKKSTSFRKTTITNKNLP